MIRGAGCPRRKCHNLLAETMELKQLNWFETWLKKAEQESLIDLFAGETTLGSNTL